MPTLQIMTLLYCGCIDQLNERWWWYGKRYRLTPCRNTTNYSTPVPNPISNPNLTLNRKLLNVWVVETRVNARLGKRPGVSPGGMCRDLDEDSVAWTDVTTTDSRASASVSRSVRCHCVSVVHCLLATRPLCCCDCCSLSHVVLTRQSLWIRPTHAL